jgi:DNA end-binding protein Ku
VVIRPRAQGLTLHTMFYTNEIRQVDEYGRTENVQPKEQEQKLAMQLIESLAAPFQPEKYQDEYRERMLELIAAKQQGQEIAEAPRPHLAPVIDLMAALKKSLAEKAAGPARKPPVRAVPAAAQTQKKSKRSAGSG